MLFPLLVLGGCLPFAVDPAPGDLRGAWLINEQVDQTLDGGIAIFAHLRLENSTPKHLKVPDSLAPVFLEAGNATWSFASDKPSSLAPGASWEGVWLMNELLPPGTYRLRDRQKTVVESTGAKLTVTNLKAPMALRTHYACAAARVSGKTETLIRDLQELVRSGTALPSTHLQLAELLDADDQRKAAKIQYETFAEKIYGMDPIPGWLRTKIESGGE